MGSFLRPIKYREKKDKTAPIMMNGKNLLEKLIRSCNGKYNPFRSFSAEVLKKATNNFDTGKIITSAASYELYQGLLDHDHPVSVMKFKDQPTSLDAYEFCFNNIVFASQMSHKNLLKLIGCCLETEFPTLVFESAEYGTLSDRIYGPSQSHFETLLLTHRLKIAMEIANALAYLHVGFPRPIVFRSINPSNILFHDQNVVKLFDFSLSDTIPEGETHITDTAVCGTMGLIAPEYMTTGACNEKCDVYTFGVMLLVLLTGKQIFDPSRRQTEDDFWLLRHVKNYIENERFVEIVDPILVGDGLCTTKEQLMRDFTELAFKCASEFPEERPTMIDVAKQLRQMYRCSET